MRLRGAPAIVATGLAMTLAVVGLRPASAAFTIHKVDTARFTVSPDTPVFILVIGNDGRPGETVTRGDALHLIGVNPGERKATILDIPRDTYVPIPGSGRDKINAAHVLGGPSLQALAVGALVGVDVPFVLDTGFEGFTSMVDAMGGVDVDVPFAMNDSFSGAVFDKGPMHMNGDEALAFARNRHLEGADFKRTEHQGVLMLAGLAKLRNEQTDAAGLLKATAVLARHVRLDGLSLADAYRLARLAVSLDPADVRNVVMPGSIGNAGGASVVLADPGAAGLFADFRDDAILQAH